MRDDRDKAGEMKELVIIMGTVVLGIILFGMIAGDGESLRSAGGVIMKRAMEIYGS